MVRSETLFSFVHLLTSFVESGIGVQSTEYFCSQSSMYDTACIKYIFPAIVIPALQQ